MDSDPGKRGGKIVPFPIPRSLFFKMLLRGRRRGAGLFR
jgi:hypothetical protein